MDFVADEFVMYKFSGICRIEGVEKKSFDGVHEESYYKLRPIDSEHSVYYVPYNKAEDKIRKLLTSDEVYALIDSMPAEDGIWVEDSRERRQMFTKILKSDDYKYIIGMMKALYQHRLEISQKGKKLSLADETAMMNAEKLMYQEFGIVIGITPDEVRNMIADRLDKK